MSVPSKLTSYFNSGRPVVAAVDPDGATADEMRAANGGVVVQSGDPQALLDSCIALRMDPFQAAQLGASGLRFRQDTLGETGAIDAFARLLI